MTNEEMAIVGEALGNPLRISILRFLRLKAAPTPVNEIASMNNVKDAAASHHLQKLLRANLVIATPCGRFVMYSLNAEKLSVFIDEMQRTFCFVSDKEISNEG